MVSKSASKERQGKYEYLQLADEGIHLFGPLDRHFFLLYGLSQGRK
jgi:hypothetical protein